MPDLSAVDAALALGRDHGIRTGEPRVLKDGRDAHLNRGATVAVARSLRNCCR
jgi:hypothetical protein